MKGRKKNIAVTGANGYLGSFISDFLKKKYNIYKLTRFPKKNNKKEYLFNLKDNFSNNFFRQNNIDTLIHCAHDFKETSYKKSYEVNVHSSEQLFKKATDAGVEKIIFISSMVAHDKNTSVYSRIKKDIEKITLKFKGIVVKPSLIVGNKPGGIVKTIDKLIKKFYVIPVISFNKQFLYTVNDFELCQKIYKFIIFFNKYKNKKFIITNKYPINLEEIFLFFKRKNKTKNIFIPINWRILWLLIKFIELFFYLPIRSDSIKTLASTIKLSTNNRLLKEKDLYFYVSNNYKDCKVLLTSLRL